MQIAEQLSPTGATRVHATNDGHSRPVQKRVVAATVAGNALEFYDFVTYAFFAVYIGKAFFPSSTPLGSLLLSVAVFGVGFITRPLGGVIIGAYADRVGRKPALLLTIVLITVGTLGLALTPTYASIGVSAPIIIVICRLVQGFALGGEVGPSASFLIEGAPAHQRAIYGSWQLASQGLATLVAGLIGMAVTFSLDQASLQSWGWRVPFAVGLLLLPVAFYLRSNMLETRVEVDASSMKSVSSELHRNRWTITLAVFVLMGSTVANYVATYMTTFGITTLKLPPVVSMLATVAVGASTIVFALLSGWLCERHGRRTMMIWPRFLAAIIVVPAFLLLTAHPSAWTLLLATGILSATTALSGSAAIVAIPELLPHGIRSTGMSIAYALGVSIFGGSTQFIVTWLIGVTGSPMAPAWYVTLTSLLALLAMMALPETRGQALR
ncbi:MAG: MFS transporter [Pseudomonadota bacterium]